MTQENKNELLIIIPAYNEEKNIDKLLSELETPKIAQIADVLIMNDASSDQTNRIVKARNRDIVTHVFNLGYGSALQLGYKYAVRRNYRYVIQMDADGQHGVDNIPRIFDELKKKDENGNYPDIVLGSRFIEGSSPYEAPLVKKIAWSFFRTLIRLATKRRIADPTTGLQGLSRRTVIYYSKFNHFDDLYPDANMIMKMLLLGFQLREVPATMYARTEGVSMHSGLRPVIYMFRMTFSILASWISVKILHEDAGIIKEPHHEG